MRGAGGGEGQTPGAKLGGAVKNRIRKNIAPWEARKPHEGASERDLWDGLSALNLTKEPERVRDRGLRGRA